MALRVCLLAQTFNYLEGGGHFWAYLNWALGLRANDCEVTWLETVDARSGDPAAIAGKLARLRSHLQPFGLDARIGLLTEDGASVPAEVAERCVSVEACRSADLLVNFRYGLPSTYVKAFRRSALVDIDPGLLQYWVTRGELELAPHDVYFTIGERVGVPASPGAELGIKWLPTLRCVSLDHWPVVWTTPGAALTPSRTGTPTSTCTTLLPGSTTASAPASSLTWNCRRGCGRRSSWPCVSTATTSSPRGCVPRAGACATRAT